MKNATNGKPTSLNLVNLAAAMVHDMGGSFVDLEIPQGFGGKASLDREGALALSAFLAHWAQSASPRSDYMDAEELAEQLAPLAPWLPQEEG